MTDSISLIRRTYWLSTKTLMFLMRPSVACSGRTAFCLRIRAGLLVKSSEKLNCWRKTLPLPKGEANAVVSRQIALEDAHPRQQRQIYFGEEIQMDGSFHLWFGDRKAALHLAVGNAARTVVGAFFDWQETLYGYFNVFDQILRNYGIPAKFKTDNRSVFYYRSSAMKDNSKDVLTQFNYACRQLGVQLETAGISQAKGAVERTNQTFQYRLVIELRLQAISSIEQVDQSLIASFVPKYNRIFPDRLVGFPSVFEISPEIEKINYLLAVLSPRIFGGGSSIKFHGHFYQTVDRDDHLVCFRKGTDCLVIKALDG